MSEPPVVASYCTTFLKREMAHVYRQVTSLRTFETFVMTKSRQNADRYPFDDIELVGQPTKNFLRRFYLKYIRRASAVVYRGEFQVLDGILRRRRAQLMHIYFGHTGGPPAAVHQGVGQAVHRVLPRRGHYRARTPARLRSPVAGHAPDGPAGAGTLPVIARTASCPRLPAGTARAQPHGRAARPVSRSSNASRPPMAAGSSCRLAGSSRRRVW